MIKTIDLGLVGSRRQYTSRGVFKTLMLKKWRVQNLVKRLRWIALPSSKWLLVNIYFCKTLHISVLTSPFYFSHYSDNRTAQKMKFSIKDFWVNVTKSAVSCGFGNGKLYLFVQCRLELIFWKNSGCLEAKQWTLHKKCSYS